MSMGELGGGGVEGLIAHRSYPAQRHEPARIADPPGVLAWLRRFHVRPHPLLVWLLVRYVAGESGSQPSARPASTSARPHSALTPLLPSPSTPCARAGYGSGYGPASPYGYMRRRLSQMTMETPTYGYSSGYGERGVPTRAGGAPARLCSKHLPAGLCRPALTPPPTPFACRRRLLRLRRRLLRLQPLKRLTVGSGGAVKRLPASQQQQQPPAAAAAAADLHPQRRSRPPLCLAPSIPTPPCRPHLQQPANRRRSSLHLPPVHPRPPTNSRLPPPSAPPPPSL